MVQRSDVMGGRRMAIAVEIVKAPVRDLIVYRSSADRTILQHDQEITTYSLSCVVEGVEGNEPHEVYGEY